MVEALEAVANLEEKLSKLNIKDESRERTMLHSVRAGENLMRGLDISG